MRWVWFLISFFFFIGGSFWWYVWNHRIDFLETAFERSCPPYQFIIDDVEIQNFTTVVIRNISIRTKEPSPVIRVNIPKAVLYAPLHSWLYWLIIPSSAPLHLRSLRIITSKKTPLHFQHPNLSLDIRIDKYHIIHPNEKPIILKKVHGSIASLLNILTYESTNSMQPTMDPNSLVCRASDRTDILETHQGTLKIRSLI